MEVHTSQFQYNTYSNKHKYSLFLTGGARNVLLSDEMEQPRNDVKTFALFRLLSNSYTYLDSAVDNDGARYLSYSSSDSLSNNVYNEQLIVARRNPANVGRNKTHGRNKKYANTRRTMKMVSDFIRECRKGRIFSVWFRQMCQSLI